MALEFEEDRQRYLRQLAITPWYARQVLPGAHDSNKLRFRRDISGFVSADAQACLLQALLSENNSVSPEGRTTGDPKPDFSPVETKSQFSASLPKGSMEDEADTPRHPYLAQGLSDDIHNMPVREPLASGSIDESDEVWHRYSWGGGRVILAKMNLSNLSTERLLLQNILKSLVYDSELPNPDEFCWPPFFRKTIPFQNNSLKNKLLTRWMHESTGSVLIVFNEYIIHGLESGSYCPSLADLILNPQGKRETWDKLSKLLRTT